MNVELKFKPGVRTSLNSNNNIRDNFGSGNNKTGGVRQVRNSTGNSAAANLSQMSLVSGDWGSKSGSILNNNSRGFRFTTTSQRQNRIDPNYVSAGRSQEYVRNKYTQIQNFGYTRADNMTGYSGRGIQRLQDAAYGMGAYAELNAMPHVHSNSGMDAITTFTGAVEVGKSLVDLGKNVLDVFSSKDSKASGGGSVSGTADTNIKGMKESKDSVALASSIDSAKADLQTTEASIPTMKETLSKAQTDKTGLEQTLAGAKSELDTLDGNIKTKQESVNTLNNAVTSLTQNYEAMESQYNKMPEGTDEQKAAKAEYKQQLDSKKQELDAKKQELQTVQGELKGLKEQRPEVEGKVKDAQDAVNDNKKILDETPAKIKDAEATVNSYEKEIPKQEKRLAEMTRKENTEIAKLENRQSKGKISDKDKKKLDDLKQIAEKRTTTDNKFVLHGDTFEKTTGENGEPVYKKNGEIITEEEWQKEMENNTYF